MTDPSVKPLLEWSRLAQENAENAVVSSMFEAVLQSAEPIDSFSTWLLVASGAVGSFFVANADKLLPVLHKDGFLVGGVFLCLSCVFGIMAKLFAMRVKVMREASVAIRKALAEHLSRHEQEEEKMQEHAQYWGIGLNTGLRVDRILEEYSKPFPWWARWLARRRWAKDRGNPQAGFVLPIRLLVGLGSATFVQALCFVGFLGAGFVFATAT